MRVNIVLFGVLGMFFVVLTGAYTLWNLITYGRIEWVGTVAFALLVAMCALIGFFLARSARNQGGSLPEDRPEATIDDGDPELGFFSPYSWWPLVLATSAALAFAGLAIGIWLFAIAVAVFLIAIVGWVYEYYRGYHAR